MQLPTPLELGALAAVLGLAAAACLWLTSSIKLCAYLAAGAAVLGLCASVAYGYERMGEDKIQPQLDACVADVKRSVAESEAFKLASQKAITDVTTKYKAALVQLDKANAAFEDLVHAQDPDVRSIRIPAAVGELLNPAIATINAGIAAVAGSGADTPAVATVPGDTDVGAVEVWSHQVITMYGKCAAQVAGLQDYVAKLVAASNKNAAPN